MLVADIINGLKYGELRHFNLGESEVEGVAEIHYPMLINLINQGMLDIYSKVSLKYQEVFIQPVSQINIYKLHVRHAETNLDSTEEKFIKDTIEEPFEGNILKIEAVYDEFGTELPMNDHANADSVFLMGLDTLQVPKPSEGIALSIIYRSYPEPSQETIDIAQELDLPLVYKQALIMFVTGKAHLSRAHMDSEIKHSDYMQRYNAELARCKQDGHYLSDATSNSKFARRGFA